ncbi:hypothetical protein SAMN05421595_2306 [Austwickia chelonae]|uniref:Uncharacterized protein n=1 Tax=Austwickia chelonae NBRC 105200 TaxID=1184607 RepID=K6V8V5_9MICO|nr:hypothetical protein [Austwickia chelonae]GAB78653.1 hypothetical protein AUCHE_16_00710 [Austwickia chelonae NBRC 105200]SEW34410.1 hypothetical protein SAMN05421595_2306 [Austwickia chelonae]
MDERHVRAVLRRAVTQRRRLTVAGAIPLIGAALTAAVYGGNLLLGGDPSAVDLALWPTVTATAAATCAGMWRSGRAPVDLDAPLTRCVVVRPPRAGQRGLRVRRPDGAILEIPLTVAKGSTSLRAGDDLWAVSCQDGQPFAALRWDQALGSGLFVRGLRRARMVLPPSASPQDGVPMVRGREVVGAGGGIGLRRPLAIAPLTPAQEWIPPEAIDETQARALLDRERRSPLAAPDIPPDAPLGLVRVLTARRTASSSTKGEVWVQRPGGDEFGWKARTDAWPGADTTAWATRVADGLYVYLVAVTSTGDVVLVRPLSTAVPLHPFERAQTGR